MDAEGRRVCSAVGQHDGIRYLSWSILSLILSRRRFSIAECERRRWCSRASAEESSTARLFVPVGGKGMSGKGRAMGGSVVRGEVSALVARVLDALAGDKGE